jgi:quercetin dioxygenase-like cupin family protein
MRADMSIRIRRLSEEPGEDVEEMGFEGVNSVWAVLRREDLTAFSSRIFRVRPGGHTGIHAHDREHAAVVIRGECGVEGPHGSWRVPAGSIVMVPAKVPHRFSNTGREGLVLLIMNLFTALEEEGPLTGEFSGSPMEEERV